MMDSPLTPFFWVAKIILKKESVIQLKGLAVSLVKGVPLTQNWVRWRGKWVDTV